MIRALSDRLFESQFFRFCIIGGIATLIHVVTLVIQMEALGVRYASVSNVFSACVSLVFAYFGNRDFVFKADSGGRKAPFVKFVFVYFCILLIHFITPLVLTDISGQPYFLSFAIALIIHVPFSFFMNKYWVFKA